jgi:putative endonuclease
LAPLTTMNRRIRELISRLLGRKGARLSPTTRLGRMGEDEAARHLKSKGYDILARNYRIQQGEIDLVAFRDGVVAFVEVRAQTYPPLIDPLETITRRKQRRVIKAAESYAALNDLAERDVALRFDVITVLFDERGRRQEIRHLEGAFEAG